MEVVINGQDPNGPAGTPVSAHDQRPSSAVLRVAELVGSVNHRWDHGRD